MKALSVQQPWAELIARGEKTIKVRGNRTRHRGPLLIVSCKHPNVWATGCAVALVVRHVTICGHGHGLQRAIIDESQHRTPERLIMAQH